MLQMKLSALQTLMQQTILAPISRSQRGLSFQLGARLHCGARPNS